MHQQTYHQGFRLWLVAWTAPSYYLNQCWSIVYLTLRSKLPWNINRNPYIFIQEIAFDVVICEIPTILSWPLWVNIWVSCIPRRCWGNLILFEQVIRAWVLKSYHCWEKRLGNYLQIGQSMGSCEKDVTKCVSNGVRPFLHLPIEIVISMYFKVMWYLVMSCLVGRFTKLKMKFQENRVNMKILSKYVFVHPICSKKQHSRNIDMRPTRCGLYSNAHSC